MFAQKCGDISVFEKTFKKIKKLLKKVLTNQNGYGIIIKR